MEIRLLGVLKPQLQDAYLLVNLVFGAVSEEETDFTSQVFADLQGRACPWDSGSTPVPSPCPSVPHGHHDSANNTAFTLR